MLCGEEGIKGEVDVGVTEDMRAEKRDAKAT